MQSQGDRKRLANVGFTLLRHVEPLDYRVGTIVVSRKVKQFRPCILTGQCKVIDAPKMLHQMSNSIVSRGVNQLILSASN